ncbi:MAG TPA: thioesterase family protein [Phycisphaerales bacterium]|nr:thioesterase family protein [Phycisphaerales bacterium]
MSRRSPAPSPDRPVPTLGTISVRVRYCECDPMGVAHHAAYVPWFEMGRTELLRASGLSYAALERAGVLLAIVRLEARYRRPARYDDLLELTTRVVGASRVKIEHEYELRLTERTDGTAHAPGELLATASTTLACIDRDGRPAPLPEWLAGDGLP